LCLLRSFRIVEMASEVAVHGITKAVCDRVETETGTEADPAHH
jgi:hypothetical protein